MPVKEGTNEFEFFFDGSRESAREANDWIKQLVFRHAAIFNDAPGNFSWMLVENNPCTIKFDGQNFRVE